MDQTMLVGGTIVLLRARDSGLETLLIRRPDRGSFPGAWVFPGGVVEEIDVVEGESEHDTAARAAARECAEEVGLRPAGLHTISCWVPPIEAPKRVRTWFFLAETEDDTLRPAADEVLDAVWLSPSAALAGHAKGEMLLFPPTWVTLDALVPHESFAHAVAATPVPDLYATHLIGDGVFAWGGDAAHPEGGAGHHRLETASLPWTYRRDPVTR
ncbi:8-oxo-dGTP pyrophosphatase MutT (NUDIX family) [Microbacterium ginsengiterrae]|uniref:8-oxo-dGTP pyrophosphatase MutT (NUDIX family) n=1 Tax=Microbacterium ginsengiterrae TaxID=546115 RepID=A0A7W9FC38_9MICO|nr:NUDIX hydrolase [Microbacterium ginsengiterrae]MBB5743800.1 8-oxo-dGTP pyrophosphatase MutT (NUDIX family) [Microbacterium ginsengiterrae]